MTELQWPAALDTGEPDLARAHRRAAELGENRRRQTRRAFIVVASFIVLAITIPILSRIPSTTTQLAARPQAPPTASLIPAPSMTIAPNPDNTPRPGSTPSPSDGAIDPYADAPPATGPSEAVVLLDDNRAASVQLAMMPEVTVGPHLTGTLHVGEVALDVPPTFVLSSWDGTAWTPLPTLTLSPAETTEVAAGAALSMGVAADDGTGVEAPLTPGWHQVSWTIPIGQETVTVHARTNVVPLPGDLQDLEVGNFGTYYIGFTGNQFGYPATWSVGDPSCGTPPREALRMAPMGTDMACDLDEPDAGLLAIPASHWPEQEGGVQETFARQTATVTTDADGATTYRFEAIDLVIRIRFERDPTLVQAILDSVDTDGPPPSSDGPDFDAQLAERLTDDFRTSTAEGPQARLIEQPQTQHRDLWVVFAGADDRGAHVSATLFRGALEEAVADSVPGGCPPLTTTFVEDCGQLVEVRGRRIAVVLPTTTYFHAFVDAPDGHVLNVVIQQQPGNPDSPTALTPQEAIEWLSTVDALFTP